MFPGVAAKMILIKVVKFHFTNSESKIKISSTKKLITKYQIPKSWGGFGTRSGAYENDCFRSVVKTKAFAIFSHLYDGYDFQVV